MTSTAIDINDFSHAQFNPKSWINSVLKPTPEDDSLAKETTILVTKLQMVSEQTSRQFDTLSSSVIQSMPRIMYDLKVIAENAHTTHQGVEQVKRNLGLIEDTTLDQLRRPHTAKMRMEECKALLTEKAEALEEQRQAKESLDALMRKAEEEEREVARKKSIQREEEERAAVEEAAARLAKLAEAEAEAEAMKEKKAVQPEIDAASEYGHVQLPPLRTTQQPPKRVVQQTPVLSSPTEDNSYLQQIQDSVTPQVSNVFKRIGVPLDKFWQ